MIIEVIYATVKQLRKESNLSSCEKNSGMNIQA